MADLFENVNFARVSNYLALMGQPHRDSAGSTTRNPLYLPHQPSLHLTFKTLKGNFKVEMGVVVVTWLSVSCLDVPKG